MFTQGIIASECANIIVGFVVVMYLLCICFVFYTLFIKYKNAPSKYLRDWLEHIVVYISNLKNVRQQASMYSTVVWYSCNPNLFLLLCYCNYDKCTCIYIVYNKDSCFKDTCFCGLWLMCCACTLIYNIRM